MNKQSGNITVGIILFIIAIIGAVWIGISSYNNWVERTTDTVEFTVKDKERVTDDVSKYLIFTQEGEVFENTDSYYHSKFNSSDIYGQLDVGKKYKCEVFGERNPYWSWYRNIVSCEEVK